MSHVYVVMGSTGEFSDRDEWPVAAYVSESDAQVHVLTLDAWLRQHRLHMDDDTAHNVAYHDRHLKTELDPNFSSDYTGTRYYVMAIEMFSKPPAFTEGVKA